MDVKIYKVWFIECPMCQWIAIIKVLHKNVAKLHVDDPIVLTFQKKHVERG